jgi:hypothetical protein
MGSKPPAGKAAGKEGTIGTTGLTPQELNIEMQTVREDFRTGEFRKSTEPGYDIEIKTKAEDGEHTWRRKEGEEERIWCRFSPVDCFDTEDPTGEHHIFQLRTPEMVIEAGEGHPIVIVESPLGPSAQYRRSGAGGPAGEAGPGAGEWVPYFGHARVMGIFEFEGLLRSRGITLREFLAYTPERQRATAGAAIANIPANRFGEWMIKPRAGRWGRTTAESDLNRQISPWLKERLSELPTGRIETEAASINGWLRRNGIPVGGEYRVGDTVQLGGPEPFSIIVEIP